MLPTLSKSNWLFPEIFLSSNGTWHVCPLLPIQISLHIAKIAPTKITSESMTAVARFYRDYENIIFISFGAFIFNFSKSIINVYNIRLYSRSQRDKHPFLFAFYAIKFITVLESTLNGEPKNVIYNYL